MVVVVVNKAGAALLEMGPVIGRTIHAVRVRVIRIRVIVHQVVRVWSEIVSAVVNAAVYS